jgi:Flp pilus assembly protein TadB
VFVGTVGIKAELIMMETDVDVEDELIRAMREELERALTEEKCDAATADADAECKKRKRTMMSLLVASVRTQRLYFVVRSAIMSLISALMFFIVVWYLGTIGVVQVVVLSIFLFAASLVLSRLFDKQIVKLSKRIINFLGRHERARRFVLKKL